MINLQIDSAQLDRMAQDIAGTEQQIRQALNSTLRKMAAWVRTRSVKGLSEELQIQQKLIRRRLRLLKVKQTTAGPQVTLWYGLDKMALIYLQAKRTSSGVSAAGGRNVSGAFIAKGPAGGRQVFKRRGAARLPIAKQGADIEQPADQFLQSKLINASAFESQFFKTFEHELSWRMQ